MINRNLKKTLVFIQQIMNTKITFIYTELILNRLEVIN